MHETKLNVILIVCLIDANGRVPDANESNPLAELIIAGIALLFSVCYFLVDRREYGRADK